MTVPRLALKRLATSIHVSWDSSWSPELPGKKTDSPEAAIK